MDDSRPLLRLLQLTDSGFPTGAFTFSHGLEGLMSSGAVARERDVAEVIAVHLREGFAGIECPAMAHAWRAARIGDLAELSALDALVNAHKPVPVFRNGSIRTGRRLLESALGVTSGPVLDGFRARVHAGDACGHHAVAFGIVMEAAGVDEATAALALGTGFVNGLAAAAVRLGVIGQGAAQRIVAEHHDCLARCAMQGRATTLADMGAAMPMTDIAGLRQRGLSGRVFAS
jgi:urease accessory protein